VNCNCNSKFKFYVILNFYLLFVSVSVYDQTNKYDHRSINRSVDTIDEIIVYNDFV